MTFEAGTGSGGLSSACPSSAKLPQTRISGRRSTGSFTQRIADKDRALLARWRYQHAARPAPPKADNTPSPDPDGILLGWVPRKLPDKSWGALLKPPGKDLPPDLVGRALQVKPRKGEPWITTIVKVVERSDDSILVRHTGHPGFPSPGGNTPAAPKTDGGGERSEET